MKVRFIKLDDRAVVPTYGSASAAGADLYALAGENIVIPPHKTVMIHTGLAMELPEGYCGLIFARSGIATKRGLAPANKVGVVDSDYRGEFMVALHNHSDESATIAGRAYRTGRDHAVPPCGIYRERFSDRYRPRCGRLRLYGEKISTGTLASSFFFLKKRQKETDT